MPQIVITAIGPDRPGLVGEFTGAIYGTGVNLADSRMVNLRGQFAILVLVSGTDEQVSALKRSLPAEADRIGLRASFTEQRGNEEARHGVAYRLKTYSMDQPGIVHRVTRVLRDHQVNIEDLQTRLESGPFMGSPIFTMEIRMFVPPTVQVREVRRSLQSVEEALNCEIDLEPA